MTLRPLIQNFDLFITSNIPGGGLGYVAVQDIPKGTLLFEERPIFRLPEGVTESDVRNALASQPPAFQQQFKTLFIGHQYLANGPYLGRFRANALPCGTGPIRQVRGNVQEVVVRKLAGLLPVASRFNHSCLPNVAFQWDSHEEVMRFYAASDIPTAQELCIAYDVTSLLLTRADRRARLQTICGFECHCPACIVENRESDNRRLALYRAIVQPPQQGPAETRVDFLSRRHAQICNALTLSKLENLSYYRETLCFDGWKVAEEAGDRNNAMLWLEKASAAAATVGGPHNAEVTRRLQRANAELEAPNQRPQILRFPLP